MKKIIKLLSLALALILLANSIIACNNTLINDTVNQSDITGDNNSGTSNEDTQNSSNSSSTDDNSGDDNSDDQDEDMTEEERAEAAKKKEQNDKLLAELLPKSQALRDEIKNAKAGSDYYFGTPTANIGSPKAEWDATIPEITQDHPRLLLTSKTVPTIKKYLKNNASDPTVKRFYKLLDTQHAGNGKLGEPQKDFDGRKGLHNYDKALLELIQIKALGYLVDGHELYGYQAIHYMKQYLRTLDIQYITSNMEREYGNTMFTAALVYDWCYDLLTAEDKKQLMAGIEKRTASGKCGDPSYTTTTHYQWKMSVGFPPNKQKDVGAVSGHGSERQVLRDYLSVAIAFYGDNNSWWNYIGKLVYSEYVPVRNYYFKSGISPQGTGVYVSGRHISDMYSAWMLTTATGGQPYENIDKTIRNFLGYECAPGKLYSDGDGTGSMQNNYEFRALSYISAYLFADEPMLAQAKSMQPTKAFGADTIEITSAMYVALTGLSDIKPASNKYEGMELLQYNGSPVGQYITHEAWNDSNSASVFMKIKERTTANHEHADAGNFMIYYKGMLTADGGVYNGYSSEHTRYYHQATVSHNSLLIYNKNSSSIDTSKEAAKKWYSGGQIWPNETGTLEGLLGNDYLTGKVIGRGHGYADAAKTQPLYAYIGGNLTYAYPEDTVDFVGRRMLTVYTGNEDVPMVFFVYDTITADNASYEKKFLLQISSPDKPTVDQNKKIISTVNGDGKLVLTCLTAETKITGVGGRTYGTDGKYVMADSKNYYINGAQNKTPANNDDGKWGRIEISSTNGQASAKLLNVMYVTDKTNNTYYESKPITNVSTNTLSAGDVEGCVFNGSVAAIFAKRNIKNSEYYLSNKISFTTSGNSSMGYYVDGMASGTWQIKVNNTVVGTATASNGFLTFNAPSGNVVLTKIA